MISPDSEHHNVDQRLERFSKAQSHEAELVRELYDFILESDSFICRFGRQAVEREMEHVVVLPEFTVPTLTLDYHFQGELDPISNVQAIEATLASEISTFLRSEKRLCFLISPSYSLDPLVEFTKTWGLYSELTVAMLRSDDDRVSAADVRSITTRYANSFFRPENLQEYVDGGLLSTLTGDQFHYFAMNPLYTANYPRHAPLSIYVLTYNDDIAGAKSANPSLANQILQESTTRCKIPYDGMFPYLLEDDLRFASSDFNAVWNLVETVSEVLPNAFTRADPVEIAHLSWREFMHRVVQDESQIQQPITMSGMEFLQIFKELRLLAVEVEAVTAALGQRNS